MARSARAYIFPDNFSDARPAASAPPPVVLVPEVPPLTDADIATAAADGYQRGRADAAAGQEAQSLELLAVITAKLDDAATAARQAAETSARELSEMLVAVVCASFPTMQERFGEMEVASFIATVFKPLIDIPKMKISVHPRHIACAEQALARLKLDDPDAVRLVADEDIALGDAVIDWRAGRAVHDSVESFAMTQRVLRKFGLLTDETTVTSHA